MPRAIEDADLVYDLPADVWARKHRLMTEVYGFSHESWEARVTPRREAFFCLKSREEATGWLNRKLAP